MTPKTNTQQKDKLVRSHGGQSNRRTKDRGESKTVFKSVLSNPFEVKWPVIAQDVQDAILDRVIELLQSVAEYNLIRQKRTRERRIIRRAERRGKKSTQIQEPQQQQTAMQVDTSQQVSENAVSASTSTAPASALEISQHVIIGINAVTKRLEEQCCIPRQNIPHETSTSTKTAATNPTADGDEAAAGVDGATSTDANPAVSSDPATPRAPIRTVLVCLPDIDPPLLVAHIPYLVAACNSKSNHNSTTTNNSKKSNNDNSATHDPGERIKLISLPKGAEAKLAKATRLRRISVLAFDETASRDEVLSQHLSSVETIVAPWLMGFGGAADAPAPPVVSASITSNNTNINNSKSNSNSKFKIKTRPKTIPPERMRLLHRRLEPTHIKQLRTTAPKDMRAAKALRAKGREMAKEERKAKQEQKLLKKSTHRKKKHTHTRTTAGRS